MATITTITLTYNEENNIEKCLKSVSEIADRMVVLDGFSKDKTVEFAQALGAEVFQKDCSYFERFQFAMNTLDFSTDWILFIDADERLTVEASNELMKMCDKYINTDINGIVVKYHMKFMGKELRYGATILKKLRIFKPGTAFMENIALDQHIRLKSGHFAYMQSFILHEEYKGLAAWCHKHITYAELATKDYLLKRNNIEIAETDGLERTAKIKRYLKYGIYYKFPSRVRSWLFYFYRYFLRLGFLDGKEGKIYAFLHAYWYRFLIDAMVDEQKRKEMQ